MPRSAARTVGCAVLLASVEVHAFLAKAPRSFAQRAAPRARTTMSAAQSTTRRSLAGAMGVMAASLATSASAAPVGPWALSEFLDAVEKDVDEGKRPGKDMDAFFQQLGRVDDAAAALPEMPIPQGALDDGADLDVVARQDLRRQLDDLAAEGHRKKNMKTLADLVEAGLDNT